MRSSRRQTTPLPALAAALVVLVGCGQDAPVPQPLGGIVPVDSSQPAHSPTAQTQLRSLDLAGIDLDPQPLARATESLAYQGTPPAALRESTLPIDRTSPTSLLDSALTALGQKDAAALARLSREGALTTDDADDAQRRFLGPATTRYWDRIAEAIRGGRYEVLEEGPVATVRVDVGGAAGSFRLRLRKEADQWYLAS